MKLQFYTEGRTTPIEVDNLDDVKVILDDGEPIERHVKVTHEGIIVDLIEEGAVVATGSFQHDGLVDINDEGPDTGCRHNLGNTPGEEDVS